MPENQTQPSGRVGFRIDTLWGPTSPSIPTTTRASSGCTPTEGWLPLIAADKTRLDQLRPYAEGIASETGRTVRLVAFTSRVELEEISPAVSR